MSGMRAPHLRSLGFVAAATFVALAALLAPGKARAQLDTRHWIPPLWAVLNDSNVDDHFVTVSTPEVSPVAFTLKDGAGNTYTGTVSNTAPVTLQIGNNSAGYAAYTAGGWAGTHTAHVRCGVATLNTVNTDGLIVESERPVYVSIRQKSGSQGEVVASPGRKGLGTEFRAIFARNDKTSATNRGSFISVMATLPGTTTVTFDAIKTGVRFYGRAATSGTTDAFTITLNQYESYIIGQQNSDTTYPFTAPLADLNGLRITSSQLITATSGFWLGGPSTTGGQDVGVDQLVPVETAGTLFVLIKGNALATNLMETVTVVATQNDTNIYVKGSTTPLNPTPLAAGGYYFVNNQYVGDGLYMTTSKPVMVVQEIGGSDSYATPGANVIPPLGADAANSVDNIPNVAWVGTATIGIVTRTGASLLVNGAAPSVSAQSITGTTEWVTYKINGLTGNVSVVSNAAVAVSLINVSGAIGSA